MGLGNTNANSPLPDNILDLQPLIEKTLDLKNYPLGRNIPYGSLDKVFEKYCSSQSIQEGLKESENKYKGIKDELSANYQARLLFFKRYKQIILDIDTKETSLFCKQKVMGYSLLKKIQHEKIKEHAPTWTKAQTKSDAESNGSQSNSEKTSSSNLEKTEEKRKLNKNTAAITIDLDHEKHLIKTQPEAKLSENAEKIVYNTINLLIKNQLLSPNEVKLFDQKIKIHYTRDCQQPRGNFQFIKSSNWTRSPKGIELLISLCKPLPDITSLQQQIEHILVHEFWHYIYFFRDNTREAFNSICRNQKKNTCKKSDFYSQYSQENQEEDYAESFAFWVSQLMKPKKTDNEHWSAPSEGIAQKDLYFNTLYSNILNKAS